MSSADTAPHRADQTCVDDVRLVREKLSAEAGNDVETLAARAQALTEAVREQLGLRRVAPDDDQPAAGLAGAADRDAGDPVAGG